MCIMCHQSTMCSIWLTLILAFGLSSSFPLLNTSIEINLNIQAQINITINSENNTNDCVPEDETGNENIITEDGVYEFETSKKANWYEAWLNCKIKDKELQNIEVGSDQTKLDNAIYTEGLNTYSFWVFGSRLADYPQIAWYSDRGPNFGYTNWDSAEPSKSKEKACVAIRQDSAQTTMKWYMDFCSVKKPYICHKMYD